MWEIRVSIKLVTNYVFVYTYSYWWSVTAVALSNHFSLGVVRNNAAFAVVHLWGQHLVSVAGNASIWSTIFALARVRSTGIVRSIIILIVSCIRNLALVSKSRHHRTCLGLYTSAFLSARPKKWALISFQILKLFSFERNGANIVARTVKIVVDLIWIISWSLRQELAAIRPIDVSGLILTRSSCAALHHLMQLLVRSILLLDTWRSTAAHWINSTTSVSFMGCWGSVVGKIGSLASGQTSCSYLALVLVGAGVILSLPISLLSAQTGCRWLFYMARLDWVGSTRVATLRYDMHRSAD